MANAIKVDILGSAKGLVGAVGKAKASLSSFSATTGVASLAAGGLAVAGVAALGALTVAAIDMDQNMREFEVSTGLTGEALAGAWDEAQDAMARVPEAFDVTAAAAGNLQTTTGVLGDDLEDLTVQFLDLNRLGFGAITENDVGEIMNSWGLDAEGVAGHLDDLATISQATGVDIGLLDGALASSAQTLQNMGIELDEATALVATLEANGVDSGKAIKGLKSAMADMTPGEQAEAWEQLNMMFEDGITQSHQQKLAFELLGSSANEIIGSMTGTGLSLEEMTAKLQGNTGATGDMAETTRSLGERFTIIKNQIMIALVPVMELLMTGVEHLATAIEFLAAEAPGFFDDVAAGAQALWDIVGPIVMAMVDVWSGMFDTIMGLWDTFSAVFRGDWAGAWEGIKATFTGIMDTIKAYFGVAMEAGLGLAIEALKNAPTAIFNASKDMGVAVLNGLKAGLSATFGFAGDVASAVLKAVKSVINNQVIDRINRTLEFTIEGPWGLGSFNVNPPDIPRLRHGGMAKGAVLVGEDGPEVLNLGMNSGRVTSRRESGGTGEGVTVNVYGSEATADGIGAAVLWSLRRA